MKVSVIGTGYVGLVTGSCLAHVGNDVICIDNNPEKVDSLKRGDVPIFEPGLDEVMQNAVAQGKLSFTTDTAQGIADADVIFLALPTPPQDDGSADLSAVLSVAKQIGPMLPNKYCVVIDKSTVPVGTAEKVSQAIKANAKSDFDVVSNPEFLREGFAVKDFLEPERVVVGVSSERAEKAMRELYRPLVDESRPLYVTDQVTAELTKYAANAFLVTKVNFMNEMSNLSERLGADIDMLRLAIGSDSRIGHKFLHPGIGCGGSCFPKDIRALNHMAEEVDYDFKLLKSAIEINDQQQHILSTKLIEYFGGDVNGKQIGIWGLAFKPNTDDIREAPALVIINNLLNAGAQVNAYDPEAGENVRTFYKDKEGLTIVDDKFEAVDSSDALLLATEWDEFKDVSLEQIKSRLNKAVIFDGRNVWKPDQMKKAGFTYFSIGRKPLIS